MARSKADKEYRSFAQGLITEATGLTYPEGSCRDIDNVDLGLDGSARRRLGIAQEPDGRIVGGGYLSDTTFTNDTGGPVSDAPSVLAASVTYNYDGTAPGNGDWTLFSTLYGVATGAHWELGAQRGQYAYIQQDLAVSDYDRIVLSWHQDELTNDEGQLAILVGCTVGGAGQGVVLSRSGVRQVTTTSHSADYVYGPFLYGYDAEDENLYNTLSLTKVDTNSYVGTLQIKSDPYTVVQTVPITLGTSGDFIEFVATSGQKHTSKWLVDDIGIQLDVFGVNSDLPDVGVESAGFAISTHSWVAPNGDGTKAFQVFQIGNNLFFRDAKLDTVSKVEGGAVPAVSQQLQFDGIGTGFIYNMSSSEAAAVKLQSTTGFGRIWFTSQAVVPFYAELAEDGASIRLRAVGTRDGSAGIDSVIGQRLIRDLAGVEDGLDPDETPASMSDLHLYNLLNQGWPSAKINSYFTSQTNYPANNQQWFLGKDALDAFDPAQLVQQDFGSQVSVKGRIMLDALLGDRDGQTHAVSGVTSPLDFDDLQDATSTTGWKTVAFYAGRLWLAGDVNPRRPGCLYYSKTLESPDDAGKLHQISDPTSEHFNQVLATDGGYISLPEAGNFHRLQPFGAGLLVFADAGVWFVYGRDGGFKANAYAVEKITSTGTINPGTVIDTDTSVLYWSDSSLHRITFAESNRAYLPTEEDIGEGTVFRYYQQIPRASRTHASGCYDPISKKAFWLWLSDADKLKAESFQSLYNRALVFDLRTEAFTKYSWAAEYTNLFGVACAFPRQTPPLGSVYEDVYDSTGELVLDSNDDVVYSSSEEDEHDLAVSLKLVLVSEEDMGLRLAGFTSLSFQDFDGLPGVESSEAESYLVTGDETLGDLQRNKQTTYVHSFFRRTEDGFLPSTQLPRHASGCTLQARWDWTNTNTAGRWSDEQQAYRYRRPYTPVGVADTFDTGEEIVYTKLKVRGKGRAVAFRYASVEGKDFHLLGFAVPYTASSD